MRSISIEMMSATGPKTIIPKGIMVLDTIVKTEITLPMKAGLTVVCNKTIEGVLYKGNDNPQNAIIARYSQKLRVSPNPAANIPHNTQENAMVYMRFLPQLADFTHQNW
jgi:hypothetical protein